MIIRATSLGTGAPYPEKRRYFLPGLLTGLQVSQNVFSAAFLWEATGDVGSYGELKTGLPTRVRRK